jgi:hypothetical protein
MTPLARFDHVNFKEIADKEVLFGTEAIGPANFKPRDAISLYVIEFRHQYIKEGYCPGLGIILSRCMISSAMILAAACHWGLSSF